MRYGGGWEKPLQPKGGTARLSESLALAGWPRLSGLPDLTPRAALLAPSDLRHGRAEPSRKTIETNADLEGEWSGGTGAFLSHSKRSLRTGRDGNCEETGRSTARAAFDPDTPSVCLNDTLDDR